MELLTHLADSALSYTRMDTVDALRFFFISAACTILSVSLADSLRSRFIPYGARATSGPAQSAATESKPSTPAPSSRESTVTRSLDYLASLQVPHSYFMQFYVVSVLSSIFWALQLLFHGPAFQAIATRIHPDHLQPAMSTNQVMVCWGFMLVQGVRRLYESRSFAKPSSSKMWFVHWIAGLAFYLAIAVALWIEGAGTVLKHKLTLEDFNLTSRWSGRLLVCVPVFTLASGIQHDCHHYLSSLKKYTLPEHSLFSLILCPHYTAECMIYLSLAVMAAPGDELINKTLLSALVFVAVNLGITASSTRLWYRRTFGENAVRGKWNMVPFIY
ncbi:hypothetical protein ARAM_004170 [Aspergillus rambellii]|uniref:Polyprenal reductase n=1 Tax=Aspergillus rambellii TaxID=308745 RepID=A0A0F8V3U6_9EURO|nr:hypothetical protein ARAM_004170 [Aspergillus rambellii]